VLPFTGLEVPADVAVDAAGNVYLADLGADHVLRLTADGSSPTTLPFNGLKKPSMVTVDPAGNVYMLDDGNFRVLKLPAR
jgi:serine/threonine-protein kinase